MSGAWEACIVAPAFPHQGRRTFEGRQYVRAVDGGWSAAGDDILRQLRSRGLEGRLSGRSAGLDSRNRQSCPIFIPGQSVIGRFATFDSSSVM